MVKFDYWDLVIVWKLKFGHWDFRLVRVRGLITVKSREKHGEFQTG
jgi:hypothetical protein